jgi:hypothetical protein
MQSKAKQFLSVVQSRKEHTSMVIVAPQVESDVPAVLLITVTFVAKMWLLDMGPVANK